MGNLVRRDPVTSWMQLPRESFFGPFEQVFDQLLNEFKAPNFFDRVKSNSGYPKMNIWQDDKEFAMTVNVAGVQPEDLKIEVEEVPSSCGADTRYEQILNAEYRILRISGPAHTHGDEEKTPHYFVRELTQRQFVREVRLPDNVKGEPQASVKNGVLTLKWNLPQPKVEEKKVKTIAIKQE